MKIEIGSVIAMVLVSVLGLTESRTGSGVETMPRKSGTEVVRTMPDFPSTEACSHQHCRSYAHCAGERSGKASEND